MGVSTFLLKVDWLIVLDRNNWTKSRGWLAQMVERALRKFFFQRESRSIPVSVSARIFLDAIYSIRNICLTSSLQKCGGGKLQQITQQRKIKAFLQYEWKESSDSEEIGSCKHLPRNTVPHHMVRLTQLWIAMPKRYQVYEEIESMEGKKLNSWGRLAQRKNIRFVKLFSVGTQVWIPLRAKRRHEFFARELILH